MNSNRLGASGTIGGNDQIAVYERISNCKGLLRGRNSDRVISDSILFGLLHADRHIRQQTAQGCFQRAWTIDLKQRFPCGIWLEAIQFKGYFSAEMAEHVLFQIDSQSLFHLSNSGERVWIRGRERILQVVIDLRRALQYN